MCTVSNVGDGFGRDYWPKRHPIVQPDPLDIFRVKPEVTRQEFDALKNEVEALKKLLQEAKRFDKATGQEDCEMGDKVKFIKRIAELVGVDLGDVFATTKTKAKPKTKAKRK